MSCSQEVQPTRGSARVPGRPSAILGLGLSGKRTKQRFVSGFSLCIAPSVPDSLQVSALCW